MCEVGNFLGNMNGNISSRVESDVAREEKMYTFRRDIEALKPVIKA